MKCFKCNKEQPFYEHNIESSFGNHSIHLCENCNKKYRNSVLHQNNEEKTDQDFIDKIMHDLNYRHNPIQSPKTPKRNRNILDRFGKNLNEIAKEGKIEKSIGREIETEELIEILNRKNKNNPVLIGEPGVGKTAIAENLALKIVNNDVPEKLKDKKVYSIDISSIVAGTSLRGQFEGRINQIIKYVESNKNVILFLDEIHTIVGAGAANGSLDAGNILKPALARGDVQVIGATTLKEYRDIEKDPALERRLQPIKVEEPSIEEAIEILKGIRTNYESYHKVHFPDNTLEECVKLSHRYIQDRFLPDKAIDLMDIAASRLNLKTSKESSEKEIETDNFVSELEDIKYQKERAILLEDYILAAKYREQELIVSFPIEEIQEEEKKEQPDKEYPHISVDDIHLILERMTGIPVSNMQNDEMEKMKNLKSELESKVIGQNEATDKVAKSIRRSRIGLKPKNRPTASFLFVGPTGVGKTELTKVLSKELFGTEEALVRLDMSEYMEKHSISKLIGSPPGYTGHEEGGQLTEKIRRNPYSIILLDELEKSHPDIQNIFLQILEDGHLTDSHGKKVDFKNTIIIATTNAGSHFKQTENLGFRSDTEKENTIIEKMKEFFKPEFLNRFDDIISFNELDENSIILIINNMIEDLSETLKENNVSLSVSEDVKQYIAKIGYDKSLGARPLRRTIQEQLEDSITDFIIDNGYPEYININLIEDEIKITN